MTEAQSRLSYEVASAIVEGEGCVPESCAAVNDASRTVIAEVRAEHGVAWLGDVNQRDHALPIWLWDGAPVCNFGADFVLPRHDAELERMIVEHRTASWNARHAAARINVIFERVKALGGTVLVWS